MSFYYPYLITRYFAAVYVRSSIHHSEVHRSRFLALMEDIQSKTQSDGFRRCLVLSSAKCIYFEVNKPAQISPEPPSTELDFRQFSGD